MKNLIVASVSMLYSFAAFSAPLTVGDLQRASQVAIETFKLEYGEALHDAIFGYEIAREEDGASAKLFYKQNGQDKQIEYFCHYHEANEIDCHEH